jgi:small-conductance mechanosensitive channel
MVETIVKDTTKSDAELKKHTGEYNEVRNSVAAIERKETGTLMVRPLGPYVQKHHVVDTEFFATMMVVVPKTKQQEWELGYETMEDVWAEKETKLRDQKAKEDAAHDAKMKELHAAEQAAQDHHQHQHQGEKKRGTGKESSSAASVAKEAPKEAAVDEAEKLRQEERERKRNAVKNIVPRSSLKLAEDAEFILYRIVVLRKGLDLFKNLCRERRYTVRDFKFDPGQDEQNKKNMAALDKHKKKLWNFLVVWCKTTFADVFSAWIHIKAMRTFVEAVLRYGLPVDFTSTLVLPSKGHDKKLREVLKQLYSNLASANLTQQLDSAEPDLSGFGQDFYPYVYLTLNLGDSP